MTAVLEVHEREVREHTQRETERQLLSWRVDHCNVRITESRILPDIATYDTCFVSHSYELRRLY